MTSSTTPITLTTPTAPSAPSAPRDGRDHTAYDTAFDDAGFDDIGHGEPALLLLPGWCGDRTVFAPLASRTRSTRRTVVTDLREHGTAPRTGEDFGTAQVVADAVTLVDELGVDRFVPVALSHAGWAAIELRRRLGRDRVPGIVLLDAMVLGTPPGFREALDGLQGESWEQVRAGLFHLWTTGVDEPAVHAYVASMGDYGASHWHRAGREIAAAFDEEHSPLAALDRLAVDEPCPTLHLYAQPADEEVLAAQQRFAAGHPWFEVQHLEARSHFPALEVPDDVARSIEEFACRLA